MLELVDDILRKWSQALAARSFYPPTHPTVRLAGQELLTGLRGVHVHSGSLAISVLDDRLLWGNDPLPSAGSAGRPIQAALERSYVDRITFDPGITEDELSAFLDSMVPAARGQGMLRETAHIRLESVIRPEEQDALLRRASSTVREIHGTLGREEGIDYPRLTEVVGGLLSIVGAHPHSILPLAKIKDHDEYTFVHTVNVAILSAATAHAIGSAREVVHDILIAGILHDVGKERIPLAVLNKPGRLTDEEAAIVKRHPEDGARMLMACPGIPDTAIVVAYEHHQRLDGSGYPKTPVRWDPHLGSRIVQMADVFDAMRTHRPYRRGMPIRKILEVFRQDSDSFTDPDLVRLFLSEVALRGHDLEDEDLVAGGEKADDKSLVQRL